MISTMQWLEQENARLRRTVQIDGIVCWLSINLVVWGVLWGVLWETVQRSMS